MGFISNVIGKPAGDKTNYVPAAAYLTGTAARACALDAES
jgi:hypothetical protein